jgi:hypothetical protein
MNPSSPNSSGCRSARIGEVPPISIFSSSRSSRGALSVPGNHFGSANSINGDCLQVESYLRGRACQPRRPHHICWRSLGRLQLSTLLQAMVGEKRVTVLATIVTFLGTEFSPEKCPRPSPRILSPSAAVWSC